MSIFHLLAQASLPAAQPAAEAAGEMHVKWEEWLTFNNWHVAAFSITTFVVFLLVGFVLLRIFRRFFQKSQLTRATIWGILALTLYFTLIAAHPGRMVDKQDEFALIIHKAIIAVLLLVGIRYLDRLAILPLLTRLGGRAPSRFIHQIIVVVLSIFVILGYSSWAFGVEIGSLLAGSAVISIVLGLALQETLGNFFSGMVLQASVPFQTGDWIQIGDIEGRVIEMTWRAVTLLTPQNNYVLLPNSTVSRERITNYHTPTLATATSIAIGLDYAIPPNDAKRVLLQAAKDTEGVLASPSPGAGLASFGDSAINYTVGFWIGDPQKRGGIEQAVRLNVWYRLNQAGFNIPFPTRTVEIASQQRKFAAAVQASQAARLASFRKIPMLAQVPAEVLEHLASQTREFSLAAGQALFRQDDPGDSIFLLVEGTARVKVRTTETPPRDIDAGEVQAPAMLGDVSAATGQHRNATVSAKTDVKAIELNHGELQALFQGAPELMQSVSKVVAERQAKFEETMRQQGATHPESGQHASHSVLDRMKRMFHILSE